MKYVIGCLKDSESSMISKACNSSQKQIPVKARVMVNVELTVKYEIKL